LTLDITTLVIDAIHTRHEKVTVLIVTHKAEELQQAIHRQMVGGITIIPAKGAYSKADKNMLYLVITRYELYDLENIFMKKTQKHLQILFKRLVCSVFSEKTMLKLKINYYFLDELKRNPANQQRRF